METVITSLESELTRLGHQTTTYMTGPSLFYREWERTLNHLHVGSEKTISLKRFWRIGPIIKWIRAVLLTEEPDVVLVHEAALIPLVKFASRSGTRLATVVYEHGVFGALGDFPLVYRKLYRYGLRNCNMVVCGSEDYANFIKQQIRVSPAPIGVPVKSSQDIILRSTDTFRIVFVGRLENDPKRIDRLLRACAQIPPDKRWTLQIVGDGGDRSSLEQLARTLHIEENCSWAGWQSDPWKVISSASLFVFPSEREGFGAVIVEAMAHGIPVLATDCDFGPRAIIQSGINGWIVPVSDEPFARMLVDLVSDAVPLPSPTAVRDSVLRYQPLRVAESFLEVCTEAIRRSVEPSCSQNRVIG